MDIVIFDMGGDWGFAAPDTIEYQLPPLFTIQGAFLSYRLWNAAGLSEAQWDAAKEFFLRLAGDLSKPGRKVARKAKAA